MSDPNSQLDKGIKAPDLLNPDTPIEVGCNTGREIISLVSIPLFEALHARLMQRYYAELLQNTQFTALFEDIQKCNPDVTGNDFLQFLYFFQGRRIGEYSGDQGKQELCNTIHTTILCLIRIIRFVCELLPQRKNFGIKTLTTLINDETVRGKYILNRALNTCKEGQEIQLSDRYVRFIEQWIVPRGVSVQDRITALVTEHPAFGEEKPFHGETILLADNMSVRQISVPHARNCSNELFYVSAGYKLNEKLTNSYNGAVDSGSSPVTTILQKPLIQKTPMADSSQFISQIESIHFANIQLSLVVLCTLLEKTKSQKVKQSTLFNISQHRKDPSEEYLVRARNHIKCKRVSNVFHAVFLFRTIMNLIKYMGNSTNLPLIRPEQSHNLNQNLQGMFNLNLYFFLLVAYSHASKYEELYPKERELQDLIKIEMNGSGTLGYEEIVSLKLEDNQVTYNFGDGAHTIDITDEDALLTILFDKFYIIEQATEIIARFTSCYTPNVKILPAMKPETKGFGR